MDGRADGSRYTAPQEFALTDDAPIEAFFESVGEQDTLERYRSLQDQYGDRLEPELSVQVGEETATYEFQVHNEIERKGQRSGKGSQLLSRLLGRRHSWPQRSTGTVEPGQAIAAYDDIDTRYDTEVA